MVLLFFIHDFYLQTIMTEHKKYSQYNYYLFIYILQSLLNYYFILCLLISKTLFSKINNKSPILKNELQKNKSSKLYKIIMKIHKNWETWVNSLTLLYYKCHFYFIIGYIIFIAKIFVILYANYIFIYIESLIQVILLLFCCSSRYKNNQIFV
jgi:hypothetical protein